jgi:hypothetical protein
MVSSHRRMKAKYPLLFLIHTLHLERMSTPQSFNNAELFEVVSWLSALALELSWGGPLVAPQPPE